MRRADGNGRPIQVASELVSQQPFVESCRKTSAWAPARYRVGATVLQKGSRNERPKGSGPTRFGSRVGHPRNADRKIRGSAMDRQHHYEPNDAYPGVVVPGRFGDRCRHSRFAVAARIMALRLPLWRLSGPSPIVEVSPRHQRPATSSCHPHPAGIPTICHGGAANGFVRATFQSSQHLSGSRQCGARRR